MISKKPARFFIVRDQRICDDGAQEPSSSLKSSQFVHDFRRVFDERHDFLKQPTQSVWRPADLIASSAMPNAGISVSRRMGQRSVFEERPKAYGSRLGSTLSLIEAWMTVPNCLSHERLEARFRQLCQYPGRSVSLTKC